MSSQNIPEIHQIASQKDFDEYIKSSSIINKLLLVHVELEQIPVCKTVNEALLAISRDGEFNQQLNICRLNADHFTDFLTLQNVTAAPTVLFYHRAKLIDRVDGFNQSDLLKKIKYHINKIDVTTPTKVESKPNTDLNIENKIKGLLQSSHVILFMKGTPTDPQCGFSRQACHILDENNIKYDYFDVLSDPNLREQLKIYSNWSTYPQLYIDGELIGGLDIMKQMVENGEFESKFKSKEKDWNKYLESLINQSPLMLFIKGTPESPQCGFTKQLIDLLNNANIKDYKTFNILQDEEVRQKLKEYSSWQTYPQIYANGQFIGGLDILKQLNEEGTLVETLTGKQGVTV
jgi:Grx4 family monothiol glutaredoxin